MRTRIVYPEPDLKGIVQYFWILEVPLPAGEQLELRTFVDDSSGMVFHDHEGKSAMSKNGKVLPMGLICGQARFPSIINVLHPFTAVGVLFHPHAIHSLFGVDGHYMTDNIFSIEEFDKASDVTGLMLSAECPDEKIKIISNLLIQKKRCLREVDHVVSGAVEMIKTQQVRTIRELLQYYRISERQLERRFLVSVGVSPRHYLQVSKFQVLIRSIQNKDFPKLVDFAREFKFSDQAHFNRVVRRFSGLTPGMLQSHLKTDIINILFR